MPTICFREHMPTNVYVCKYEVVYTLIVAAIKWSMGASLSSRAEAKHDIDIQILLTTHHSTNHQTHANVH